MSDDMCPKITVWSGHPLDGGVEIPGELLPGDDGQFHFRPYVMPSGSVDVYVMKEDGDHGETVPLSEMRRPTVREAFDRVLERHGEALKALEDL